MLRRAFFSETNPCWICEIPLYGVKYGFAMRNACGHGQIFISRSAQTETVTVRTFSGVCVLSGLPAAALFAAIGAAFTICFDSFRDFLALLDKDADELHHLRIYTVHGAESAQKGGSI